MIQYVVLRLEHLAMLGRSDSGLIYDAFPDFHDRMRAYVMSGMGFTALDELGPIACGGVAVPWKGVGEAWLIPGRRIARYGVGVARACRRILEKVVRAERLHRVQALQELGAGVPEKWFRLMGFVEPPVLLRKYTPTGRDCLLYARIF